MIGRLDVYRNHLPHEYEEEKGAAERAGVVVGVCPSQAFDDLIAENERLIFVITVERVLIVAPQVRNGFEIRHPVLAGGADVLAAGELELIQQIGMRVVLELNNKSGHYQPPPACLDVAIEVLKQLGFEVPPEVVDHYPGN